MQPPFRLCACAHDAHGEPGNNVSRTGWLVLPAPIPTHISPSDTVILRPHETAPSHDKRSPSFAARAAVLASILFLLTAGICLFEATTWLDSNVRLGSRAPGVRNGGQRSSSQQAGRAPIALAVPASTPTAATVPPPRMATISAPIVLSAPLPSELADEPTRVASLRAMALRLAMARANVDLEEHFLRGGLFGALAADRPAALPAQFVPVEIADRAHGLRIVDLDPDDPATRLGLRVGDILLTHNGRWLTSQSPIARRPPRVAALEVLRGHRIVLIVVRDVGGGGARLGTS